MAVRDWFRKARDTVVGRRDLSETGQFPAQTTPMPTSSPERVRALEQAGMGPDWPYSPGMPLPPFYPGYPPRQYQYRIGQNIGLAPRSEVAGVSFEILRDLTDLYDVARLAINVRIEELTHLDWDIVPRQEEDKGKFDDVIRQIRLFLERPDGVTPFDRWLAMLANDWLAVDALCLYRRYNRAHDKLVALEVVDGTTIKPLIDARGRVPLPPAPAYQQFWYGYPMFEFDLTQIIYRPYWARSYSPYGFPPAEWVLTNINTDIRLQWNFLAAFTAGNIPEAFGTTPEGWTTQQIREWQEYWDALMAGDWEKRRQIRWVPFGFQMTKLRETPFDKEFPEWLAIKTLAAYGVSPQEIGITTHVNRATGEQQQNVQFRRSIKPGADFMASVLDQVLAEDFHLPQLRFKFLGLEEEEDALAKAQRLKIYIDAGVISPDEVRQQELGLQVDAEHPAGRVFVAGNQVLPLDQVYALPAAPAETPAQPDARATGNQAPVPARAEPLPDHARQDRGGEAPRGEPGTPELTAPVEDAAGMAGDLLKWQRKALNRLAAGKRPACTFESEAIPSDLLAATYEGLRYAESAEDVKRVFRQALAITKRRSAEGDGGGDRPRPPGRARKGRQPVRDETRRLALQHELAATLARQLHKAAGPVAERLRAVADELSDEGADVEAVVRRAVESYGWRGWADQLRKEVEPHLQAAHRHGAEEAERTLDVSLDWRLIDPRSVDYARERAAELVGKRVLDDGRVVDNPNPAYAIDETTREMIRQHVVSQIQAGSDPYELADQIAQHYAFSAARAETIARTETGTALNRGAVDGYEAAGVESVEVIDGDYDPECAEADGQVWSVDYAAAHPLQHPNCTRGFAPIVASMDEGTDEG